MSEQAILSVAKLAFSYNGSKRMGLRDLTLEIPTGTVTAILGPNGSGKTTLVNLLPRFWDVTGGSVTIDGIDVRDIPQDNLREIVGIALQEAVLFKGDLRFNLKFANPEAEDVTSEASTVVAPSVIIKGLHCNIWSFPSRLKDHSISCGCPK